MNDVSGQSEPTLVQWVKKNGERGKRAFARLVQEYQPSTHRILKSMLSREDARDASQEAFLIAYQSIGNLRDDAKFGAWLRSITVRTAYRIHRSQKRANSVEIMENDGAQEARQFSEFATREAIHACLQKLPFIYREALVLRYVEELSYQEISEVLKISVSATKMRVMRARDDFQTLWPHEPPGAR